MPRGVYDRSKSKAKRDAEKAAQNASSLSPGPGKKTKGKQAKSVSAAAKTATVATGQIGGERNVELYRHLQEMNALRAGLVGPAGHNENLLAVVDGEIIETVKTLKSWRERAYPTASAPGPTAPSNGTAKTAPVPAPMPAPTAAPAQTPGVPAPPLPFTPQAVQELQKTQQ